MGYIRKENYETMKRILFHLLVLASTQERRGSNKLIEYDEYNGSDDYYDDNTAAIYQNAEKRYPGAIIIGVRKCGTRALLAFCGLHPNIVHAEREVHFFDRNENYNKGPNWYKEQMPYSIKGQITMEKTPGYYISPDAPSRIWRFQNSFSKGKLKIIIVVRDPIERIV